MTIKNLKNIDHFVVVMFENRSFDHMLGFLYPDKKTPKGHDFEGLTGKEFNYDKNKKPIHVKPLKKEDPYCYFTPRADPGEGLQATSNELFGDPEVLQQTTPPTNSGFVKDYEYTLNWQEKPGSKRVVYKGAGPDDIMKIHTSETLPILSTLAKEYAVCDQWFCSVPSETQCNRAFMHMATSEGMVKNDWNHKFTSQSIFDSLTNAKQHWKVYVSGEDKMTEAKFMSYAAFDIESLQHVSKCHFGSFHDFKYDAKKGKLPAYSFLEPVWGADGNSMHPNYNVANGEKWLKEIYDSVRYSPQWEKTLLIVLFDEHGGCYDHVAPPANATPPGDMKTAPNGFKFDRFGVRVPFIAISPLIEKGTVLRTGSEVPFDHTSILKTLALRFDMPTLTNRDKEAPHIADLLTLSTPRTDDPLAHVAPPVSPANPEKVQHPPGDLVMGIVHRAHQLHDPNDANLDQHLPEFDGDKEAMEWAHEKVKRYVEWKYQNS